MCAAPAQLLGLLDAHALEPGVVLLAAPALARVLMGAREAAMAALEVADALSLLADVVMRQARGQVWLAGDPSPHAASCSSDADLLGVFKNALDYPEAFEQQSVNK